MNRAPLNTGAFISTQRSPLIKLALSLALGVLGTVGGYVRRRARIAQGVGVAGTVGGHVRRRARIHGGVGVLGFLLPGRYRRVRAQIRGGILVGGSVTPRARRRGRIAHVIEIASTVAARVYHRVRFGPVTLAFGVGGRVGGVDVPTGPAPSERRFVVSAQERVFVVPGDDRRAGVA